MTPKPFFISRRRFLKGSAAVAIGSALPSWFIEESAAHAETTHPSSPNDQPAVALIGCGGMGRGDAYSAARFGRIVALCDVDEGNLAGAKEMFPQADTFKDFRKLLERDDIDIVICGTPDHWHTQISIAAMRAGKDVYCEKPLTLTIDEGKRLIKVSRETGRILQTGSQQRSEGRFRLVCEMVRNGRIGRLEEISVFLPAGRHDGPFAVRPVPEGLDWDFWQGQTPYVDYVPERCHQAFRFWYDYSGGTMTDWGAHHNDIALWGLGLERGGPVSVEGRQLVDMIPGGYTAASQYDITYTYANGVRHTCRSTPDDGTGGGIINPEGQRNGVRFKGSGGWLWVTRGYHDASNPDWLREPLASDAERLYVSNDHMGNFFECVQTRKQPICDVEIGHRSASLCHLGVISMRLGRKLEWNPEAEHFVGDEQANGMVAREMREPWNYDIV